MTGKYFNQTECQWCGSDTSDKDDYDDLLGCDNCIGIDPYEVSLTVWIVVPCSVCLVNHKVDISNWDVIPLCEICSKTNFSIEKISKSVFFESHQPQKEYRIKIDYGSLVAFIFTKESKVLIASHENNRNTALALIESIQIGSRKDWYVKTGVSFIIDTAIDAILTSKKRVVKLVHDKSTEKLVDQFMKVCSLITALDIREIDDGYVMKRVGSKSDNKVQ